MSGIAEKLREAGLQLLQPGASHELVTTEINGIPMPTYLRAPANLREALDSGRAHGDKTFVVYQGERYTFDQFFEQVDKLANLLIDRLAVGRGDRVAIAMRNCPEWMIAYTAVVSVGAVIVPLNSWGQAAELEHGLTDAGAHLVFCDQQRLDYIAPRLGDLGISAVVVRSKDSPPAGALHWSELLAQAAPVRTGDIPIEPDDLAMIMYTSGTTGKPKGAASTHRAICQALHNFEFHAFSSAMANAEVIGKMMAAGFEPSTLLAVPLFHVSGCFAVFMLNLRGGRKTAIMYKWDVSEALKIIERERITTFTGVPAMTLALLESPEFEKTDVSSLFAIGLGGAACPPHLAGLVYDKLPNGYPGTGYGMTETNATGASCTGAAFRELRGTAGMISPIVQIKTVDEQGRDLPRGEQGEIYVRSPTNARKYWNQPEASAAAFRDGWVATGDVGYVDADNFLYVVDRIKDMVIRAGENIYPVEVEGCILQHPQVEEVCAYGVPHPSLGEELAATVYSSAGVTAESVKDWVADRLAGYKIPSHITIQDQPLPKNATGKVLKKQIRQAFLDKA